MIKKSLIISAVVSLTLLVLALPAQAEIQYGQDAWGINLNAGESITCIAHFVWSSVEFNNVPIQRLDLPGYNIGGDWTDIGWQTALSSDNKIAYIFGPTSTNTTGDDYVKWFAFNLSYNWDDADPNFDPDWPVYIDTALYNGPPGSEPFRYFGYRGTPGIPESWEFRHEPYAVDEPWYTEDFFDNPAPEPMTICLLGLGSLFLRKRRLRA